MRRLVSFLAFAALVGTLRTARGDTRADARRYFQQGMALIDQGNLQEGAELLKKAYALRPHPSVLFNIGRAYASAGAIDPAIEYFERYLDTDPSDSDKVEQTVRELKERKKLRSLVDEGMTAIDQGRYFEGIALLKRAYETRPHPNILFNIARAYEDARDYRHAVQAYERYLKAAPQDSEEVNNRLKRLRPLLQPKKPAAKKPPEIATKEADKADKSRGKSKVEPEVRHEPERPERPSTSDLDDAQLEKLAQMIAQMMKRESGGAAVGGGPAAEPGLRSESEVPERGARPEDEPAARPPSKEHEAAVVEIAKPTTATAAGEVTLEAKTGEAYEEVVVTASRRAQSPLDAPNAVTVITEEDIRLSGAQTVPDLLRRVPGMDVMAMSYTDYNVSMRGFNRRLANKILVLIDGRTVYEDFLGIMLWRSMSIDLVDIARIEVVRGPGSAIYGAYAYTGIVNIITKRPEEINGSVARVSAGNGSALESVYQYGERRGPLGIRASVGYQRGNRYELEFDPKRIDYTSAASDPNLSLEQARFDATTEYNVKSTGGRIFAGGGARTGFQEIYGVATLRNQNVAGQLYNVRGGYESDLFSFLGFWNGIRVDSSPSYYPTGENALGSHVRADLIAVEPVFRPTFSLGGDHALVLGGEYRHKFIDWDYLDKAHSEDFFAVFAQDQWTLSPQFTAIASGRLDLHPIIGPLASPRLALIFKPTPRQAFRASAGTAFRQPTQSETYVNLTVNNPSPAGVSAMLVGGNKDLGNKDLKPEGIQTIDVGYLVQPDFGEFEAVVYLNRVSNLIDATALVPVPGGGMFDPSSGTYTSFRANYANDTKRYLGFGTELSARLFPFEGVDVGANYAFQYIYDQDSGERFASSPIHKLNVWAQLRTRFGLDFAASAHVVSSQRWRELLYDVTASAGTIYPIPPSVVIIGRVGYRLFEDKLELAVSGVNLGDFGSERHREHPFANRLEARVLGSVTARF
jgi:iron complex outermembrane recepter protein